MATAATTQSDDNLTKSSLPKSLDGPSRGDSAGYYADKEKQLLLRFRHVYAGKGGWYGYKTGQHGPINSRSKVTSRLSMDRYKKEVMKKVSFYMKKHQAGQLSSSSAPATVPRAAPQSTNQQIDVNGNVTQHKREKSPLLAARTTATPISLSAGTTRNATSTEGRTDSLLDDHHDDPSDVDVSEKMISSDRAVVSFSQVDIQSKTGELDCTLSLPQDVLSRPDSKDINLNMTPRQEDSGKKMSGNLLKKNSSDSVKSVENGRDNRSRFDTKLPHRRSVSSSTGLRNNNASSQINTDSHIPTNVAVTHEKAAYYTRHDLSKKPAISSKRTPRIAGATTSRIDTGRRPNQKRDKSRDSLPEIKFSTYKPLVYSANTADRETGSVQSQTSPYDQHLFNMQAVREKTFEITPAGFDIRYQDPMQGDTTVPEPIPDDVRAKAIAKVKEWLAKYCTV